MPQEPLLKMDLDVTEEEISKMFNEKIENTLKEIHKQFPNEDLEKHRKILQEVFIKEKSPKEVLGFDDAYVEALYAAGYQYFEAGDYNKAIPFFRLLMDVDFKNARYMAALGSCYFGKKEWEKALIFFVLTANAVPKDPMSYFHIAECYIEMNLLEAATFFLNGTIINASNIPTFAPIKNRAEFMLNALNKTINEKVEQKGTV